jgi:hypothetical protein
VILIIILLWLWSLFQTSSPECHPLVARVRFDGEYDPRITIRLHKLYVADQNAHRPDIEIDIQQIIASDRQRREEVMIYLQAAQIIRATQLYEAAIIFQNGDCPAHFQLAADLALRAHKLGDPNAGWLYAIATDRYLLNTGVLQRYGTQYTVDLEGHFALCPVDSATTDADRAQWGLPPLAELRSRADEIEIPFGQGPPHPWAWLARLPLWGEAINRGVVLVNCLSGR